MASSIFESEAFAFEVEDLGVVKEAVEDGGGGGDVLDEFAPFLDGAIGSHEGGAVFISAHDDFEEEFTGFGR